MTIPESQLETWSHQGSVQQSSATYNSIKDTLTASGTPYAGKDYEVFLQGSYGNDTNIWSESDVDIVIKLNDAFDSDISLLDETATSAWNKAYATATYTRVEFRRDVLKILTDKYGKDVTIGNNAIAIAANGNRRKADVIVATQFRRYFKFNNLSDEEHVSGICFWNKANERISNYPKLHSANLTEKHQASSNWLKPMVRIIKNLRGRCISDGSLKQGIAPSYYLEGLLYNVPSEKFGKSYQDSFINAFTWIQTAAAKDQFVTPSGQHYLLRDGYKTCWPKANGEAFLSAAIRCWNDW